jgi:hypothetical protein
MFWSEPRLSEDPGPGKPVTDTLDATEKSKDLSRIFCTAISDEASCNLKVPDTHVNKSGITTMANKVIRAPSENRRVELCLDICKFTVFLRDCILRSINTKAFSKSKDLPKAT